MKNISLGKEVFYIKNWEVFKGKICGYKATFFADYSKWMGSFQEKFGEEKHILNEICLNIESQNDINGIEEWFKESLIFDNINEAKIQLKKQKNIYKKYLLKKKQEIDNELKKYVSTSNR